MKQNNPIIGQEAICPDGLGRVSAWQRGAANSLSIQVETYFHNRSCIWDAKNVELIDPRPPASTDPYGVDVVHPGSTAYCDMVQCNVYGCTCGRKNQA